MRVAVVTESFLPTVNGVTNSVCKVLDHLRVTGHEAMVIAPTAGAPRRYAGFPVHEVPAVSYREFPVGLPNVYVQRLLSDFNPDVLHAASPFLLGAQAIAAANRQNVPSVAIFQTDVAGYAKRNRLGPATRLAWRLVRWVHDGADRTLVPSSASAADLSDAGIERVERWGRGVDLEGYHPNNRSLPQTAELRERLSPDGEIVIGYVGRIAPEKQVERLEALRGIRGISIAIVGDGPSLESVRRRLDGMNVHFLGRLSGAALQAAYSSFDVFVHAGTEETFGQTLQEAFASGRPVVAPRAGGPIDLVDHGANGYLFEPDSNASLRECVEALVDDAPRRLRMGEAGRRSVIGRSWSALGDELLGHYEAVVSDRAGLAPYAAPASLRRMSRAALKTTDILR
ncbi:glycosyltransferase family 4 protein [Compostimonas suwonensis]|uniref:D-inositol 3-phosphate glycosyltransferase n=1 Tax=Compostimonas suwonensis TaxID=1048394 RepID=A0A2M9BV11_9MICO|nr:glycosyltransferase family 1 protein [Compostimonas suwonensis]PJJ61787.1 phosphatidylinositol alpha 1,6-mannosyltransferase [Compostimonas suwonensis]